MLIKPFQVGLKRSISSHNLSTMFTCVNKKEKEKKKRGIKEKWFLTYTLVIHQRNREKELYIWCQPVQLCILLLYGHGDRLWRTTALPPHTGPKLLIVSLPPQDNKGRFQTRPKPGLCLLHMGDNIFKAWWLREGKPEGVMKSEETRGDLLIHLSRCFLLHL